MVTSRLDSIISFVEQANTPSDLTRLISMLISHIPLTVLQTFVKHHVQSSSNLLINRMYRDVLPIDHILPDDLIQNVLSFDRLSLAPKAVSKAFRRLSGKNDSIELKQRNKIIQDPQYDFKIDFQSETRWIVCTNPNRHQLSEEQLVNGYKGPFKLGNALKQCQDEDVLLLHDGEYIVDSELVFGRKSLSLVGMGDNVIVKLKSSSRWITIGQGKMYFKNMHLKKAYAAPLYLDIQCGHLWMEQCTLSKVHIDLDSDHATDRRGSLHLKTCHLFTSSQKDQNTINIIQPTRTTMDIIGCTFTGCGDIQNEVNEDAIIEVYYNAYNSIEESIKEMPGESIKIVGNIFSDNKGRSVVFTDANGAMS
eukprot:341848_1